MKVQFVAGFGPIVRDLHTSARFYREALGLPLPEGDYVATDDLPGVRHFGLSEGVLVGTTFTPWMREAKKESGG